MKLFISAIAALFLLALLIIAPAFAGEGTDEVESNNSKGTADSITDFVIEGNMDEDDAEDWYVLNGQEGLNPTFTIYFDAEELEVDFAVYSDDEMIDQALEWGTGDSITCEVPGTCYIKVWWWEGEGDYTITINPKPLKCEGDDEIEPNDDVDNADYIESALEINGYICEDDDDWFQLGGQEGTNPTFTISFDDEECEIDFEVYSDDEVVGSATGFGTDESVTCEVPGTCYVHVYHWDGEGEYTIDIEP
ncbi:MAG: hypothetical protein NTY09_14780 [bacterium]|nr:hypothetical protein [bacterium]